MNMKKLLILRFLTISFCFSTSAYAYLDVATFDGKILYIPTVRIGESILYDVELSYAEGTVFNFQKSGHTIIESAPTISTYSATEGKLVIDELQYRFQTYTGVGFVVTPEGQLKANSAELKPEREASHVEVYNLTSYPDEYFHNLAVLAENKMANLEADVLAIFYPLGEFISAAQPPTTLETIFRGATFEKILAEQDRLAISSKITEFLKPSCPENTSWTPTESKNQADILADWLLAGGGGQTQVAYCPTRRVVFVSVQTDRLPLTETLELERVIFHELYHAFQKDLWDCPNNKDTGWIVEAGAEYFAQHLKSDVEGNPQSFGSRMLARGISEVERNGKELADPGIAEKGLVVFRYMIEKGWLAESRILDGSFYHNCARNEELTDSNEFLAVAKINWSKIVLSGDVYKFAE